MRSVLVVRAYFSQNPVHYHDSMMPLHGFVYTRALIFLLGTMGPTRSFTTNVNSQFVYAESVFGAALISIGHCHGSWPVPVYLLLIHFLGKISLWVEEIHESSKCVTYHTQLYDHSLIFDDRSLGRTISLNLLQSQSSVTQGFGCANHLPSLQKCHQQDTFGWISSELGGRKNNVYLLLSILAPVGHHGIISSTYRTYIHIF